MEVKYLENKTAYQIDIYTVLFWILFFFYFCWNLEKCKWIKHWFNQWLLAAVWISSTFMERWIPQRICQWWVPKLIPKNFWLVPDWYILFEYSILRFVLYLLLYRICTCHFDHCWNGKTYTQLSFILSHDLKILVISSWNISYYLFKLQEIDKDLL